MTDCEMCCFILSCQVVWGHSCGEVVNFVIALQSTDSRFLWYKER